MSEWQPIETAPKTGRTVLLGYFNSHGNWRTMRGQWFSQEVINETWEEPEDYDGLEGWYETSVEADDVPNCWATDPTHWMPLPAPPKLGAGGTVKDLSKCPQCGGEADNGHDRCHPPTAYLCSKCSELHNAEVTGRPLADAAGNACSAFPQP